MECDDLSSLSLAERIGHRASHIGLGHHQRGAIRRDLCRARYYDAAVGRWISEDPLGFAAGDANVGRYVGNGPSGDVDPSGEKKGRKGKHNIGGIVGQLPNRIGEDRYYLVIAVNTNAQVGHAWVGLIDVQTPSVVAVGLHPARPLDEIIKGDGRCPGLIADELGTKFDFARAIPITDKEYERIGQVIDDARIHPPIYDIIDYNCTSWAIGVCGQAGHPITVGTETRADIGIVNDDSRPNYRPRALEATIKSMNVGTLFPQQ
jgi:RHS repeat-associated protein